MKVLNTIPEIVQILRKGFPALNHPSKSKSVMDSQILQILFEYHKANLIQHYEVKFDHHIREVMVKLNNHWYDIKVTQ